MELRRVFDGIPDQFDRWRPRYCPEAFRDIAAYAALGPGRSALEIGPGTGQATEPVLRTGCDYLGVELGARFTAFLHDKFAEYPNFHVVNDDFITRDFGDARFDLAYSAATIQWIPEEIAFPKTRALLRDGGALAMMLTRTDQRTANEALYQDIQSVYERWFRPEARYGCRFTYENASQYGFTAPERREYRMTRVLSAEEFVAYTGTHCDHITLKEPYRTAFFDGIREAVLRAGGTITLLDTVVLFLARKITGEGK